MNRKQTLTSIIVLSILTMTACSPTKPTSKQETTQTKVEAPAEKTEAPANKAEKNGKITVVWYPNESGADSQGIREIYGNLITKATGKEVEHKLTTDYAVAIEAIASGKSQIAFMGAQGYIEANKKNADVLPLFVNSGPSGTLNDAIYYSWLTVNKDVANDYKEGDNYSINKIEGKSISFVSPSSTSGFKVPSKGIVDNFKQLDKYKQLTQENLTENGSTDLFKNIMFGNSHQGSAVNLLTKKAEVAAFCDTELAAYAEVSEGNLNEVGSVMKIKAGAAAPFEALANKEFTVIKSTPVLNGPFAYNAKTLSEDDKNKIVNFFTSDELANDETVFIKKGSENKGFFKKSKNERFVKVEDSWYEPIRKMSE